MVDIREKLIYNYIQGKNVLDLGVGDTTYRFLHKFIQKNAKLTLGIEIDEQRARKLSNKRYNILQADAETVRLRERFDVVLAGDLIEHINNPGALLKTVQWHLKNDGLFIFTTPNIYAINYLLRGLIFFGNVKHFHEHTIGFTEQLLKEILRRHDFEVKKVIYFNQKEITIPSTIQNLISLFIPKWREYMMFVVMRKKYDR